MVEIYAHTQDARKHREPQVDARRVCVWATVTMTLQRDAIVYRGVGYMVRDDGNKYMHMNETALFMGCARSTTRSLESDRRSLLFSWISCSFSVSSFLFFLFLRRKTPNLFCYLLELVDKYVFDLN